MEKSRVYLKDYINRERRDQKRNLDRITANEPKAFVSNKLH